MEQRIIKFRGNRIDNKELVYGGIAFVDGNGSTEWFITYTYDIEGADKCTIGRHRVLPKTTVQFTGVKDKNNADIFDKDIVKTPAGIGYIEMHNGVTWIHWNMEDSTTLYNCKTEHLEIIGTMNSNPELIK